MKTIVCGHVYAVESQETGDTQILKFIRKEKEPESEDLFLAEDGTTTEDVISVVIERLKYLQNKFPCRENACAITKLEEALMWQEKRTVDRKKRGVEGMYKM